MVSKIQIRGAAYNIDSIEVMIFSLHFTFNICRDKGTQFFLIIPVTDQNGCEVNLTHK